MNSTSLGRSGGKGVHLNDTAAGSGAKGWRERAKVEQEPIHGPSEYETLVLRHWRWKLRLVRDSVDF